MNDLRTKYSGVQNIQVTDVSGTDRLENELEGVGIVGRSSLLLMTKMIRWNQPTIE